MPTEVTKSRIHLIDIHKYTDTRFPGSTFTARSNTGPYDIQNNTRILQSNPDYKVKIAKGQDASSPYTRIQQKVLPYNLRHAVDQPYNHYGTMHMVKHHHTLQFHVGSAFTSFPEDSALRDLALTRFKRKINSSLGKYDSLVPLAELREMRAMIKQTALMGVKTVKALLDLRKGNLKGLTNQIADTWLYFSFGVNPLLKDIADLDDAIKQFIEREDHVERLASGANKTWTSKVVNPGTTGTWATSITSHVAYHHELFYKYTGGFDFQVKSSNNYGIASTFGFEVPELPSVLWELTPYSWIFDYFTNVGEYLGDTFVIPPGMSKYMTLSTRYTVTGVHTAEPVLTNPAAKVTSQRCLPGYSTAVLYKREVLSALPRVGLHFDNVDQIGTNAVNRLLNLSSLLVKGIPRDALRLQKYGRQKRYTE